MTSQPFDLSFLETSDLGRRTLFQSFLNNFNQQRQAGFGIPSFGDGGIKVTPMPSLPIGGGGTGGGDDKLPPDFGGFTDPSVRRQQGGGGLFAGQQDFLSGLFNPTFNRFLGQIGSELQQQNQGGEGGITKFGDFLGQQFDPNRELARATQRQQGINTGNIRGGRSRFLSF